MFMHDIADFGVDYANPHIWWNMKNNKKVKKIVSKPRHLFDIEDH